MAEVEVNFSKPHSSVVLALVPDPTSLALEAKGETKGKIREPEFSWG